jgi:cell division protein FtsN
MGAKLQQQKIAAYSVKSDVAGKGTWYRVRVGPYTSKAEASEALDRLAQIQFKGIILETK